jgi:hypothetical protein
MDQRTILLRISVTAISLAAFLAAVLSAWVRSGR